MMNTNLLKNYLSVISKINFKTIYFNFKYLPFRNAVLFPILLSKNVRIYTAKGTIEFDCPLYPGIVKFGYGNVSVFDNRRSRSIWEVSGKVIFKGTANIGHGSKISVGPMGVMEFGKKFVISAESTLICHQKITFGEECLLSWDILIMDTDFHKIINEKEEIINEPKSITVGDKVWIGCRALILKGTIIPNGSIIAANSTITKAYMSKNCIIGGNPERIIKEKIFWKF